MHVVYLGDEPRKHLGAGSGEVRQGREGRVASAWHVISQLPLWPTGLMTWDRV